jgi:hypothetical protein
MTKKRLSEDALAYFREQGAKGGKIGGKRTAALRLKGLRVPRVLANTDDGK